VHCPMGPSLVGVMVGVVPIKMTLPIMLLLVGVVGVGVVMMVPLMLLM
jgi:hypothetical protein